MKSKLAIVTIISGWLLFATWLIYDYFEYQARMIIHIFQPTKDYESTAFHILILLAPLVYTIIGYLVNERVKLLKSLKESEEKYRALSLIDELTGLYNRRGFFFLAEQQLKISNRTKKGILLLFTDLDDVKSINDTLGHNEGDKALIDTANILKNTFRKSDIIARIGGDEFAILALETSETVTELLSTRLQDNLKSYTAEEARLYKLSLSTGFARYDYEYPIPLEELLIKADANMYEQKRKKPVLS